MTKHDGNFGTYRGFDVPRELGLTRGELENELAVPDNDLNDNGGKTSR